MSEPVLSLCIPTFNRSRYLHSLLESLATQMAGFPYAYEIVVSDNASTDDTPQVLARHSGNLPLRCIRQSENIGCFANVQFVMMQAAGKYVVYLSDDDCVLGEPLAEALADMEAHPEVAVTYAPWLLYDLVDQKSQGQFYSVPHDLYIEQGAQATFLDHILRHQIFPEIHIARADVLHRLMPRINEHAFYAFTQAADYLAQGAVMIRQQPFYVSMTRYFADEQRSQAGNQEVEYAWDRYRGGLEYMMARAGQTLAAEERAGFHLRIQHLIAVRMSVAIRLRYHHQRDPIDTYTIAMRLKGMGYEHLLPVPLNILASRATLHFLLQDPVLNHNVNRLLCVGPVDTHTAAYLRAHSSKPVAFTEKPPQLDALNNTLVFLSDRAEGAMPTAAGLQDHQAQVVRERDLCDRFGLVAA